MKILKNLLCHSEALDLLERLENESVDLVYLDPPWYFEGMIKDQSKDDYLEEMFKVLQQSKRVVKNSGFIFIYCTPKLGTDFHNLIRKVLGNDSFINEFIVPIKSNARFKGVKNEHETIIAYSKYSESKLNYRIKPVSEKDLIKTFPYKDEGGRFFLQTLFSRNGVNNEIWNGEIPPPGYFWQFSREKLESLKNLDLIFQSKNNKNLLKKYFSDEDNFESIGTIWNDIERESSLIEGKYLVYNTIPITDRILRIATQKGDWVLDPFCGDGAMLIQAFRQDRKFIGCENYNEKIFVCDLFLKRSKVKYKKLDPEKLKLEPIVYNIYESLKSVEDEILMRIKNGENQYTEFKESAVWDYYKNIKDKSLKENIIRCVCGFLNSKDGGDLFIGVKDDGKLQNLSEEFKAANPQKNNFDGYVLFLNEVILSELGKDIANKLTIESFEINECEICRIRIQNSDKPIFYKGEFMIRSNGQSVNYNNEHFYKYLISTGFKAN